jgi:cytochrome b561
MNPSELKPWPVFVKVFHWASAALILTMLMLGMIMTRISDIGLRFDLYQWHKMIGIILLLVTTPRLLSRLIFINRIPHRPLTDWRSFIAATVHGLLYLLVFAVAFSGWIMVSASPLPIPISILGLFEIPPLVSNNLAHYTTAKSLHGWLTKALLILVLFHIFAALKHHFIDRDDTLARMLKK